MQLVNQMLNGQNSISTREQFNQLVTQSIVSGLTDLLGADASKAILFHIKYDKFRGNPEEFSNQLRSMFNTRADLLERVIIKEISRKLNVRFAENEATDFNTFVRFASELFKERRM